MRRPSPVAGGAGRLHRLFIAVLAHKAASHSVQQHERPALPIGSHLLAGFGPPHVGQRVVGASLPAGESTAAAARAIDGCAAACLQAPACNSFNWLSGTVATSQACELNGWGPTYVVTQNTTSSYYSRIIERNDTAFGAAILYALQVPSRAVELGPAGSSPFATAFDTNLEYLRQYPVDDVLYWFRVRAGDSSPPGGSWGWDHWPNIDMPYGLKGSVAGLYMMGLGGALRWRNDTVLWERLSAVVGNISALQHGSGFAMAFPMNETNYHENPNYVSSWVTHGLLEAHDAGVPSPYKAYYSFEDNQSKYLPNQGQFDQISLDA